MMKAIIKRVADIARVIDIPNELKSLQNAVGGYIETVPIYDDLVAICNEEGRIMGLPYNFSMRGHDFVGTVLFVGVDGEEFADVPKSLEMIFS